MNVMRKLLSTMCAALLITLISGTTAHAESFTTPVINENRYVGDMNNDGVIDASDASAILSAYSDFSIGKNPNVSKEIADVTHDGAIDASDASMVLGIYSELSVGQKTALEVVSKGKKQDENDFAINDLIQFTGISWYIHNNKNTTTNDNLYLAKSTLNSNDVFSIAEKCADDWYGVYVDGSKTKVYVLIQGANKNYFKKIGYIVWTENNTENAEPVTTTPIATTSTTSTIVTTADATSEVVTTSTVTSTAIPTTSTTATTSMPTSTSTTATINNTSTNETTTTVPLTTEDPRAEDTRHCLQAVQFIGQSWNVRSSPEFGDNVVDYLDYGDVFFINRKYNDGWYSIILKNQKEQLYAKLDEYNFLRLEYATAVFYEVYYDESCNIRSSMDTRYDSNIVGTLKDSDMVVILETYSDGWQKIRTKKQEAYVYGRVLNIRYKPFEYV